MNHNEEVIVICNPSHREEILLKMRKDNPFFNVKFLVRQEVIEGAFGAISPDGLNQLVMAFPELGFAYLDASLTIITRLIYFKLQNAEFDPFVKIIQAKGAYTRDELFGRRFENKKVIVYDYDLNLDEELRIALCELKILNYESCLSENKPLAFQVTKFKNAEEELIRLFNSLKADLKNGLNPNEIVVYLPEDLTNSLLFKRLKLNYQLTFNSNESVSLNELPIFEDYINSSLADKETFFNKTANITKYEKEHINLMINLLIEYDLRVKYPQFSQFSETDHNIYLTYHAKKVSVPLKKEIDAIFLIHRPTYQKAKKTYIIDFSNEYYPSFGRQTLKVKDSVLKILALLDQKTQNKIAKTEIERFLNAQENIIVSYHQFKNNVEVYPSSLINEYEICVKEALPHYNWYSRPELIFRYNSEIETNEKYRKEKEHFLFYRTLGTLPVVFKSFNPQFKGINREFKKPCVSATSLTSFYECSFKYYCVKVLGYNSFNEDDREALPLEENAETLLNKNPLIGEDFNLRLGNLAHEALEKFSSIEDNDYSDLEAFFNRQRIKFSESEWVIAKPYLEPLKLTIYYNQQIKQNVFEGSQQSFEKEFKAEKPDVLLNGRVDTIFYNHETNKYTVIDFKSGGTETDFRLYQYGLSLQLPFYLYLIQESGAYPNGIPVGSLIQQVLPSKHFAPGVISELLEKDPFVKETNYLKFKGILHDDEGGIADFTSIGPKQPKTSSRLTNDEQLGIIFDYVNQAINRFNHAYQKNEFLINPLKVRPKSDPKSDASSTKPFFDACNYCPFQDLCFKNDSLFIEKIYDKEEDQLLKEEN